MPTTIPALRGKFGDTEYWITTMHVAELVQKIQIPSETPGWESLSIEEKWQRDVTFSRIKRHIAPYFASDPTRFTGALVLAVYKGTVKFEPLGKFGSAGVPELYKTASQDLDGREMLVPIDGQHRVQAFKFAMSGVDEGGNTIEGIVGDTGLGEDQVAILLIHFDTRKSRKIFSKLNRYAKKTSMEDNIITDDDDAVAIITRRPIGEDGILPARLVRIGGTTLPQNAPEFIPLTTFYTATYAIAGDLPGALRTPVSMNELQREIAEEEIRSLWELLFSSIGLFSQALEDVTSGGDETRMDIRKQTLLGKPVGQLALVRAFLFARNRCKELEDADICQRLNKIDWDMQNRAWENVLVAPNGRVLSGKGVVNTASEFIAYLCGAPLTESERSALKNKIAGPDSDYELPPPIA